MKNKKLLVRWRQLLPLEIEKLKRTIKEQVSKLFSENSLWYNRRVR